MLKRSLQVLLLVSLLSLATAGAAYAQGDSPGSEVRRTGVIHTLDLPGNTFTLRTLLGGDVHVHVTGSTEFRSPDGDINGFEQLEQGMRAQVIGEERGDGTIQAVQVIVARAEDLPPTIRVTGEVLSVDLGADSFTIQTREGRTFKFQVIERTTFRGRDDSIQSLGDLQIGMAAMVAGVQQEVEWNALLVAAGMVDELKERAFRVKGEITQVVPGQRTFELQTQEGEIYSFIVNDRTRFRSPDGTVVSIHDLKKGMVAVVGAIETEENGNLALLVAASFPVARPERPIIDVRAAGKISAVGSSSLTIENRAGESKTFVVDGNTIIRSRSGSISSFDDLEVGMMAVVRGSTLDDGRQLARWLGVGQPPTAPAGEQGEVNLPAIRVE